MKSRNRHKTIYWVITVGFLLLRLCLLIHVAGQFEAVAQELWECKSEVRARQLLARVAVLDGFLQYLMFRDIQVCLGVGVASGHEVLEVVPCGEKV